MAIPLTDVARKDRLESFNPATGEPLAPLAITRLETIRSTVASAREAQGEWADRPARARRRVLLRLADLIVDRQDEIAQTDALETGKSASEALYIVAGAADAVRYYASLAVKLERGRRAAVGPYLGKSARVFFRPRGVAAVISPWNYPFYLAMAHIAPALAAGNAVVHKPSEHTPRVGLLIAALCREAGLPADLVQIVVGDGAAGAAIIDAGVDVISFTGAPPTGQKIMAQAAQHLTPVVLELGGKDAVIVCDDADLERAANFIAWAAFVNAGQTCVALKRVIAHDAIHDRLLEMVAERVRRLEPRAGADAQIGALTLERETERLDRQVRASLERGARLVTGGGRLPGPGVFYAPTVLADCTPDMPAVRDETFGPLLTVQRASNDDHALALANDCDFGLAGSIFTEDRRRAEDLARRFRTGGVCINDGLIHAANPRLPFGGTGHSGFGRVGGEIGFATYCNVQPVMRSWLHGRREVLWHPYTPGFRRLWKKAVTVIFHSSWRRKLGAILWRK
jgi:succinate-semialdehyde dehydrogenase/glutarate-semialdehyde dehydrogenase